MSASNVIVVICFKGGDCRVKHLYNNAVELCFSSETGKYGDDIVPSAVYKVFKDSPSLNFVVALLEAERLVLKFAIIEYGIKAIDCGKTWDEIVLLCAPKIQSTMEKE